MADIDGTAQKIVDNIHGDHKSEASQQLNSAYIKMSSDEFKQLVNSMEKKTEKDRDPVIHTERNGRVDQVKVDDWRLYAPWNTKLFDASDFKGKESLSNAPFAPYRALNGALGGDK
jgi:hypothetical protein